ncbi:M20/M25/M40 family metallo-hydrolase [Candidatus Fermentibacteria bacterium]|nr:M20/M25/M40 family metallo-hydrolase [Candidatus Fermentibacteria bacterium]
MTHINSADMTSLILSWAAIPSPTGEEQAVLQRVEHDLARIGWSTSRIPVNGDRFDILAGNTSGRLVFTTHLDVVPPHIPPRRDGRVLWGRGVVDAKGAGVALLAAASTLKAEGHAVSLLYVVGEEVDSDGAKAAASSGLRFDYVLNGEPTENVFASYQKGTLRATIRTSGISCHSGYPEHGASAIDRLVDVLADIRRAAWPESKQRGRTTVNIGNIEGGVADNVLAPDATARLMFRTIGPCDDVLGRLEEVVGDRAAVERGKASDPLELYVPPGFPSAPVAFGSDLPYLRTVGIPMMLGPGSILVAHGDGEHVAIEALEEAVRSYTSIGRRILQGDL